MATEFDANDRNAQVRHPLQTVRRFIRRYVLLETAAILVLGVACWFWLGLIFDFCLFNAAAFDWMLELDFLDPSGKGSFWVRALVAVLRGPRRARLPGRQPAGDSLICEFSDPAVAMVLERRFPRELGDRLITAVELSDPKKAQEYGFSGDMLRQTIREAAERVERLPVAEVFDWARLRRLWLAAIAATAGLLAVTIGGWLGIQAVGGHTVSPFHALYGFRDVATVWMERNALLKSTYWPRNSHLEIIRFQDTDLHPDEMRVGRNEQRPDLIVRAVEWVVPDKKGVTGWRGLLMTDVQLYFVPAELLNESLPIPEHWGGWIVDLDDLPKHVPTGLVPQSLQGKTIAELDDEIKNQDSVKKSGHLETVENLGNWQTWTFDKLLLQVSKDDVKDRLKLAAPGRVLAADRRAAKAARRDRGRSGDGASAPSSEDAAGRADHLPRRHDAVAGRSSTPKSDRKFTFGLGELKESVTFFVRGGDFFTRPLRISLVRRRLIVELNPRQGRAGVSPLAHPRRPGALKGKRQIFRGLKAARRRRPDVDRRAARDRPHHPRPHRPGRGARRGRPLATAEADGILIRPSSQTHAEAGVVVPDQTPIDRDADSKGFSVSFKNVTRPMEFQFEFFDLDNVRGFRKMQIRPIDDPAPRYRGLRARRTVLRKGRIQGGPGQRSLAGGAADGFSSRPRRILPVNGTVHDDVDLTKILWAFETQPITIEKGTFEKNHGPGRAARGIPDDSPDRADRVLVPVRADRARACSSSQRPTYLGFVSRMIARRT